MLIQIHSNQIPQFWDVIAFAAMQSDNIKEEYQKVYLYTLLQDLLAGKKYCFIGKKDNNIAFVVILSFKVMNRTQLKYLYFDNIYSFFPQDAAVWEEVFIDMGKIAKEAQCKAIIGDSSNNKVHEICLSVGASCSSHRYEYYL